jgi:hypothetical protein
MDGPSLVHGEAFFAGGPCGAVSDGRMQFQFLPASFPSFPKSSSGWWASSGFGLGALAIASGRPHEAILTIRQAGVERFRILTPPKPEPGPSATVTPF